MDPGLTKMIDWIPFIGSYPPIARGVVLAAAFVILVTLLWFKPEEKSKVVSSSQSSMTIGNQTAATINNTIIHSPPNAALSPSVAESLPSAVSTRDAPVASSGPFEWYFGDRADIFGWNEGHDGSLLVGAFNVRGKNVSQKPITSVEAHLQPELRTSALSLFFVERGQYFHDTKALFIEPGAEFQLSYIMQPSNAQNSPQGVSVNEYLSSYGGVRLVMRYGADGTFEHDFGFQEVKETLLRKQRQHDESRKQLPSLKPIQ